MNPARDHGDLFAALDDVGDLTIQVHDLTRDRDHWRDLAQRDGATVTLDAILTRCADVVAHDQTITGPALALELLTIAGEEHFHG